MMGHRKNQVSSTLPYSVFRADWIRNEEAEAAEMSGVSLYTLMQRAGDAAFNLIRRYYPNARHWLVLAGHGNNGGDGYIVASLARQAGMQVSVIAIPGTRSLPAEATQARQAWLEQGGTELDTEALWPEHIDIIVDGLLGTGLLSAPKMPYDELIERVNHCPAPVMALDIPSGLNAETGHHEGAVIQADHTVTFIVLKPGLLTGAARDCVGHLHLDDLGLSEWITRQVAPIQRLTAASLMHWLKPRRPVAHKGEHGRLLIVGGDEGTGGAVFMAGEAALRSGAGLVRVLTNKQYVAALVAFRPELMVQELTAVTLRQGMEWADVVVIGPGLGQRDWGKNALRIAENCNKSMLWDADALNLLAINPHKRQNRILTPHPGEAARLLNCRVSDIESDRLLAARKLVKRYGGVVVLKGAGTVIANEQEELAIADVGNPGMASGGMGDVLSGIIGAFLAQKLALYDAACAGCVVHGAAADKLAKQRGTRGMLATDLMPVLSQYVNPEWISLEKTE
ncbi:bifunctional ADP-dependent NAD(P)H-hydrate dehydratase/NAD(P)H-hydrate epimerase [Pectobacteriaceae bacterium CE90]|nr:bifunctional ADP-dependent NAD(P)H-hydrate dehydratase/NAD(P)H-hydrate epimerase [Prodigiosinella sp. LS101]WJV53416.1 bifunctional ADP-dependent NAD(P)H-hydrate dehydratase/NAD(P)H-hydrate epimerase [Prodigiosinella sp. LS101]WJV57777.1 bifunctional ADP-dependent NAD(P)H-hydrate dehydratase/NAD(P)H-hydrate epimerase [Pectobacteriaceae bacterium C111]WJY15577.1 bifunctional ADP-dependent NAD(P)H-hydrate dehydratase/NAD(P)H-hydrate epimerase [Pectobacteriaceae bacterium CE90]